MVIRENVILAPFTTLKIGGPARYFAEVVSQADVENSLNFATEKDLPTLVLGGGSNILVSDNGFEGVVINIASRGASTADLGDGRVAVTAKAGEPWDDLVKYCVEHDLSGIENLSGIPGLVGGTPVQNVGAYGQEVSETIVSVRCFDRCEQKVAELDNAGCGFSYRTSIFNSSERDRYVVLEVTFALKKGGEPNLTYRDLRIHFRDQRPGIREVREAVLSIRRAKSMVIEDGDPNARSAGSFFKNPVVSERFKAIKERFGEVPSFPFANEVKIPAAWLIENAGFHKGYRLGRAGISTKHTLALVNCGGATAAEIVELKNVIQNGVNAKFEIELVPEPVLVGF